MMPFILGIGFYLLKIGRIILDKKHAPWLLILCFADPVLASQSILVSPDVVLVCFFLMGLYAVLKKENKWLLLFSVIGLGLTSMRGMMVAIGLFVFSLFSLESTNKLTPKIFLNKLTLFIPGGILAGAFLLYHWQQTGWIGHHAGSPWAPSFERVGVQGFVKNIAVLGWRMLDFGRVFFCLAFLLFFKKLFKKDLFKKQPQVGQLLLLAAIIFLVTIPTQLMYKGLLAHRYFLPFFISLHLLLVYFIFGNEKQKAIIGISKKWFAGLVVVGFVSGNFWIYPKKISQGWDSTLAHTPWYGLVDEVQTFLSNKEIPLNNVGTVFPNIGPRDWYELDGKKVGFTEKDFNSDCYILYSNIMNDFSDDEIDNLESGWPIIYQKETMGVCLIIYKNPNHIICGN